MSASIQIPQPWGAESDRESFMAMAFLMEDAGMRLVTQTLFNGYPDDGCEDGWHADGFTLTDWRTGEHLHSSDLVDDGGFDYDSVIVVERRNLDNS